MQVELNSQAARTVVTFENLALPNLVESKKAGRPVYDDVPVCRIRFPGNKQTTGVFPAHEVFRQGPDQFGFIGDITYAMEFNEQYKAFLSGSTQTQAGTPTSELPFLTQGKRLELKAQNIHTAEQLAAIDGQALKQLGPGARDWKNQAIAFLEVAASTAGQTHLNEALADRDAKIEMLMKRLESLEGKSNGQASIRDAYVEDEVAEELTEELLELNSTSAFGDWETKDVIVWIKDADAGIAIQPSWRRAKILQVAGEIAAAKKK